MGTLISITSCDGSSDLKREVVRRYEDGSPKIVRKEIDSNRYRMLKYLKDGRKLFEVQYEDGVEHGPAKYYDRKKGVISYFTCDRGKKGYADSVFAIGSGNLISRKVRTDSNIYYEVYTYYGRGSITRAFKVVRAKEEYSTMKGVKHYYADSAFTPVFKCFYDSSGSYKRGGFFEGEYMTSYSMEVQNDTMTVGDTLKVSWRLLGPPPMFRMTYEVGLKRGDEIEWADDTSAQADMGTFSKTSEEKGLVYRERFDSIGTHERVFMYGIVTKEGPEGLYDGKHIGFMGSSPDNKGFILDVVVRPDSSKNS